ncbi:HTTM domain-containing protein [Streptomyces sp. TRM70308]|uniref:HTTM domain-containing protein n=1 Tax=Streptomyces sp. TRM70308 TaxID=3131932 RepID=UPI003D00FE62
MTPAPVRAPQAPARARLTARLDRALVRGFLRVTGSALGPYQTAVVRIGFAATWLFFLLREFPHRHELYGPDSPWHFTLAERLIEGNDAFTVLMWSDSALWFEFVYAFAALAAFGLLVGWRTRTLSVFFLIGVLSLQNRSVFMGDGGDNVIHLMALYLVLTRCGRVWSLDARRERRAGAPGADATGVVLAAATGLALVATAALGLLSPGWTAFFAALWLGHAAWWAVRRFGGASWRTALAALGNLLHNGTLLVIMAEVCLIYATAGWYKVQGSRWQDGTAVYYPLHLDYFTPWPALSELLGGSGVLVMLITYATVITQVAFPFTVFNRRIKNVLLVVMMLEHASIAVVLGLPFFSLAMIAADAVFLPTAFLLWLGARFRRRPRTPAAERPVLAPAGTAPGPPAGTGPGTAPGPAAEQPDGPAAVPGQRPAAEPRPGEPAHPAPPGGNSPR